MSHGIDINKIRLDDLDREVLRDSLREPFEKRQVCNFGSGEGKLSLALSSLGHTVYSYDCRDLQGFYDMSKELFSKQHFTQIYLQDLKKHNIPAKIDIVVAQRVLHYMKYSDVIIFLSRVFSQMSSQDSIMYISLSGKESQLGNGYDAKKQDIENRMGKVSEINQENFNITEPICLYDMQEATNLIAAVPGLKIKKIWQSQFGNIKIIAQKNTC